MRTGAAAVATIVIGGLVAVTAPASVANQQPGPKTEGMSYQLHESAGWVQPAQASVVEKRTAELTAANRPSEVPIPAVPHHQLVSAGFTLDLADGDFYGDATVAAAVPDEEYVTISYYVGTLSGSTCNVGEPITERLRDTSRSSWTDLLPGWEDGNCVVAELRSQGVSVDALVGDLNDELPELSVGAAELPGSRRLGLVRGVWTSLSVPIANAGPGTATEVVVTGRGKGLKVREGAVGYELDPGDTGYADIRVKLTGKKKKAKLRFDAAAGTSKAKGTAKVVGVAPPARPQPGRYRSNDGDVSFSVKGRTVVGFYVRTPTNCGSSTPDQSTAYSFPRRTVPRNGIIDAADKGSNSSSTVLRFKIAGNKVTKGYFNYNGPGGCYATKSFTARRR